MAPLRLFIVISSLFVVFVLNEAVSVTGSDDTTSIIDDKDSEYSESESHTEWNSNESDEENILEQQDYSDSGANDEQDGDEDADDRPKVTWKPKWFTSPTKEQIEAFKAKYSKKTLSCLTKKCSDLDMWDNKKIHNACLDISSISLTELQKRCPPHSFESRFPNKPKPFCLRRGVPEYTLFAVHSMEECLDYARHLDMAYSLEPEIASCLYTRGRVSKKKEMWFGSADCCNAIRESHSYHDTKLQGLRDPTLCTNEDRSNPKKLNWLRTPWNTYNPIKCISGQKEKQAFWDWSEYARKPSRVPMTGKCFIGMTRVEDDPDRMVKPDTIDLHCWAEEMDIVARKTYECIDAGKYLCMMKYDELWPRQCDHDRGQAERK